MRVCTKEETPAVIMFHNDETHDLQQEFQSVLMWPLTWRCNLTLEARLHHIHKGWCPAAAAQVTGSRGAAWRATFTCTCIYPQASFYSLICCTTAKRRLWTFRQAATRCFLCCRHRFVWLNLCMCVTVGAWTRKQRALVMMVAVRLSTLHQLVFIACLRTDTCFWSNIRQ